MGPGEQRDIRSSQGRPHAEHVRIGFGMHQTGEAIAAIAPAATAEGHVGLIQHHPGRGMEGMQSGQSQIIHQLLDAGLMGHRRMGIGAAAGGLGGILAPLTMHVVHLFRPLVIGLEVAVTQGPGWRNAVEVMKLLKILLPQAEVGRAIHLGGPTDEVMAAGLKRLAVLVVPHILGDVPPLLEDLLRVPVLGFLREPVATLQHQNL